MPGLPRFRRRSSPTGNPVDDAVLRGVEDRETPRPNRHFLYCRDERSLIAAVDEARDAGWTVEREDRAIDTPGWVLVACRTSPLDAETVRAARTWWEDLARRTPGGHYDGWELS